MWVRSLGCEDLLEEEVATHSHILAREIPWTEGPGRLQSMGSQKSRTRLSDSTRIVKLYWNTAHSFSSCLWLLSCFQGRVESLQPLPHGLQSLKYLISRPVHKTCSDPCCRTGDFLGSFSSGKVKWTAKQVFCQ